MSHLIKLLDGSQYNLKGPGMGCGDYYKNSNSHKLVGTKKQVEVLINLIKRFKLPDLVLSQITDTSFIFSSKNRRQQIFVFRLCRYIRNKEIFNILEKTIELNSKNKLAIYHSFVLAHHIRKFELKKLPIYYSNGMDLIRMQGQGLNFSFTNHDEFIECLNNKNCYYTSIFYYDSVCPSNIASFRKDNPRVNKIQQEEYSLFISYIKEKKYKKAINLIKNRV